MNKYFLNKDELAIIAPYVDSESLLIPEVTPKRNGAKARLLWAAPSKEDVATIIEFTGLSQDELSPLIGMSNVTLWLYKNQRSDYNISYTSYVLLCRMAARKLAGKKIPSPGGSIFTQQKEKVLTQYVDKGALYYPTQGENEQGSTTLIYQSKPSIEQASTMINRILDAGYVTTNVMQIFGLQDRITRAKKKDSHLEFSQFILLCEAILKIESGKPL